MSTDKTSWFISCAKEVHGDTYDYTLVDYINAKTKVSIVCHEHGVFNQTPDHHKRGKGCRTCSFEKSSVRNAHSKEHFIRRANSVHNSKYSYDDVVYVNARTKVSITCPTHGNFLQTPDSHNNSNYGCKACATELSRGGVTIEGTYNCPAHGEVNLGVSLSEAKRRQFDICPLCNKEGNLKARGIHFINRAVEVHGSRYDYSNVDYLFAKDKVEIICHKHGSFFQTPNSHTNGNGCKKCALDRDYSLQVPTLDKVKIKYMEKNREAMELVPTSLYLIKLIDQGASIYKIGVSRLPDNRYKRLREVYGDISIIHQADIDGYQAYLNEMMIHKALADHRHIVPSKPEGHTELFDIDDQLLHTLINQLRLVENLV